MKSQSTIRIGLCAVFILFTTYLFAQVPPDDDAIDSGTIQNPGPQPAASLQQAIQAPPEANDSVSKIVSVRVLRGDVNQDRGSKSDPAFANDIISIKISNAKQFFLLRPTDFSKLVLYANGIQLRGIISDRFSLLSKQDVQSGKIILPDTLEIPFQLLRDSTTQGAWKDLYNLAEHWYSHKLTFNADLGWEGMFPLSYSSVKRDLKRTEVTVVFYQTLVYWIWVVLYVTLIVFFIFLCATSNLIREGKGASGAYSLAQTQLVFWTVLIIGGFIYSVVLTDLTSSLNPSVLLMLGVSIGTTGLATGINYYKKEKGVNSTKKHQNFFYDILSDGETLSVHRTQIMLWNVVFGIYLVFYTITNKTMPEFSATMLVLSGVSSTFYLGSKIVENGNNPPPQGSAGAGGVPPDPNGPAANVPADPAADPGLVSSNPASPVMVNNPVPAPVQPPVVPSADPPILDNGGE